MLINFAACNFVYVYYDFILKSEMVCLIAMELHVQKLISRQLNCVELSAMEMSLEALKEFGWLRFLRGKSFSILWCLIHQIFWLKMSTFRLLLSFSNFQFLFDCPIFRGNVS